MRKLIFTIGLLVILSISAVSQVFYDTIAWVRVNDDSYKASSGLPFTSHSDMNSLLNRNGIVYYEQAMPFAKTPELLKIHEIRCESQYNIDDVFNDLTSTFTGVFDHFSKFKVTDTVLLYDPIDPMYNMTNDSLWLWHLKIIQANLAWDFTKGDPNVKTAVIDLEPDVDHPDLFNTIEPHFDPLIPNVPYT